MPLRQRRSGGSRVTSSPAKITLPASGATVPVAMPNNVVFPAPFGPMMPSASPSPSARSIPSATTTAPKRLEIFSRERMGKLTQRLQLPAERNLRRGLVLRNDKIELAVLALPLAGDERRLGHVLHRLSGPLDRADDGFVVGRGDRIQDRLRVARVLCALEHVDGD